MAVLIGNNSGAANGTLEASAEMLFTPYVGLVNGTATQAKIPIGSMFGSPSGKIVVYNSDGSIRAISDAFVISSDGTNTTNINCTIEAGKTYFLGFILSQDDCIVYGNDAGYNSDFDTDGNYASPPTVTPFTNGNGAWGFGNLSVWLEGTEDAGGPTTPLLASLSDSLIYG